MGFRAWLLLAAASFCATWLVFLEYLPPLQSVGIHSDLASYHFPLLNFAWQELREGRLPLWDPAIYCGISYPGITQEALFYPPNWLLFVAAALGRGMTLKSLEVLVVLHLWAGFLFCFAWLHARFQNPVAAFTGAAAFALGGMPLSQIQHVGVVCCYIWIPLALGAIERARRSDSLRPYLTVAFASAMAFLAGYPSTLAAFVICVACWAVLGARPLRHAVACAAALLFSLLLAAAQLVPALEANATRLPEKSYSGGLIHGAVTYLLLLLPNYFDSSRPPSGVTAWGDYFYLGGLAVFGLCCLVAAIILRRRPTGLAAPLLTLAVALVLIGNPLGAVDAVVSLWPDLASVLREYNLLPCLTVMACCLAAHGIAWFLRLTPLALPAWSALAAVALSVLWCARLLWLWIPGGLEFASGWATLMDVTVSAALAAALLIAIASGRFLRLSTAMLVLLALVELKSFGTNRRFSAEAGHPDKRFRALRDMRTGGHAMAGMEQSVLDKLRADRAYRVLFMDGLNPLEAHYYGLATPQGFEASLPARYRNKVAAYTPWRTNRLFEPALEDESFFRDFAVRYLICLSAGPTARRAAGLPFWRALGTEENFYRVFEYTGAAPAYRWTGAAAAVQWLPGLRVFDVSSATGGRFALLEQNLPGWTTTVDGIPAATGVFNDIFQSVDVPAGPHRIEFSYRPRSVAIGVWVSIIALASLIAAWSYSGRSRTA